jgi:hypothetical protein
MMIYVVPLYPLSHCRIDALPIRGRPPILLGLLVSYRQLLQADVWDSTSKWAMPYVPITQPSEKGAYLTLPRGDIIDSEEVVPGIVIVYDGGSSEDYKVIPTIP